VARGRAAHGSRPEVGRDAIRQLGRFLAALDTRRGRLGPPAALGPHAIPSWATASFHAGTITGG
jgi:acetylornithine deacetylase